MGPGHFGVGFAAKTVAPKAPLWILLVASETLDLLSAVFLVAGMEKMATSEFDFSQGIQTITPGSVPWSHGLFMSIIWSLLFGALIYLLFKDRRAGTVTGLVIFSHWLLDLIVHPPDLPILFPGSTELGLGLWSSAPGLIISLILELALLAGGITIYVNWRKKRNLVTSDQVLGD